MNALACPVCGCRARVEGDAKPIPLRAFDFEVSCSDDCGEAHGHVEYGATREAAVLAWNDHASEEFYVANTKVLG